MKKQTKAEKISRWGADHWDTLQSLFKDFQKEMKDKTVPFPDFVEYMYHQCKH